MGAIALKDALESLDPANDAQWTADGLPRMDVVETLIDDKAITRKDVTEADPELCREVATKRREEAQKAKEAEEKQDGIRPEVQGRQEEAPKIDPQEQLRADIVTLDEQIKELGVEKNAIDKIIIETQRQRDALQQMSFGNHSAAEDTKARMAFIKSQNEARATRYERGRKILQIVGKDGLTPKCRLDQAMMRKTARGMRRPPARTPKQL